MRRDGGTGGGDLVPVTGTGVCLADAREPAIMASESEPIGSWDEPVLFRLIGKAGVTGRAEAERGGRAFGVSVRDAGSKTGGDSARVGVEDADTKVSLDDIESPVSGLPSALPWAEVGLDES